MLGLSGLANHLRERRREGALTMVLDMLIDLLDARDREAAGQRVGRGWQGGESAILRCLSSRYHRHPANTVIWQTPSSPRRRGPSDYVHRNLHFLTDDVWFSASAECLRKPLGSRFRG